LSRVFGSAIKLCRIRHAEKFARRAAPAVFAAAGCFPRQNPPGFPLLGPKGRIEAKCSLNLAAAFPGTPPTLQNPACQCGVGTNFGEAAALGALFSKAAAKAKLVARYPNPRRPVRVKPGYSH
jgi:hypothetical protein